VSQVEAAQSLSTLEKLAIGSYTEYLRDPAQDHQQQNLSRSESFNVSLGLFGQIYCLNGLKIKDDSANYPRQSRTYNCLYEFRRETSVLDIK
jgi:hypothetical protein